MEQLELTIDDLRKVIRITTIVTAFFNGDEQKVTAWFNTKNHSLGYTTPLAMICAGRTGKLLRWVTGQLEKNALALPK